MVDRTSKAYRNCTTRDGQEIARLRTSNAEGKHEDVARLETHHLQSPVFRVRIFRLFPGILQAHHSATRNGLLVCSFADPLFTTIRLRHHHVPHDGMGERQVPYPLAHPLRSVHYRHRWSSHHFVLQASWGPVLWPVPCSLWYTGKRPRDARIRAEPDCRCEKERCCCCSDDQCRCGGWDHGQHHF